MSRCRHTGNVLIYEEVSAETVFVCFQGGLVDSINTDARPTGYITAHCKDCGRMVRRAQSKHLPKWARILWDHITGKV